MKKFISQIVKEQRLNIKIYRDYFCSNKKVYKEHYFALIDYICSTNDIYQKYINRFILNSNIFLI